MTRLLTSRFYRRYFNAVSPQWDWLAWIPCQHRITLLEQLMQWQNACYDRRAIPLTHLTRRSSTFLSNGVFHQPAGFPAGFFIAVH
ncbi:hypothetical protein P0E69_16720 [Chimaeribacter arupi]|uniref:glucose uptake inhibitor SgrT n=1 Tax=Chimaeribacter arupi TaxID=2060066 RepID=UPI002711DB83|nr:glucose uptake inhibitor SgrT [Chimaeribacter arupi]WKZ91809.1 hypothetical protein P0E69_16720 [Chimaeribacter arupi]